MSERGLMGSPRGTRSASLLLGALAAALCAGLLWTASAHAGSNDYSWTGSFSCGGVYGCSYDDGWSEGNWGSAPQMGTNLNIGTLSFPALPSCSTGASACYESLDDIAEQFSVNSLVLDNAVGYYIHPDNSGDDGVTLGSGGLTATATSASNAGDFNDLDWSVPLLLSTAQTWSDTGANQYESDEVGFDAPVTAGGTSPGSDTLQVNLADEAGISFGAGLEAGAITFTGANTSDTSAKAIDNGYVAADDINAGDGSPVTFNDVDFLAEPNLYGFPHTQTLGPLTAHGAFLQIGDGNSPDVLLQVNGDVTLNSADVTAFTIDEAGATPGTDFSQLQATGPVALAGSLVMDGCGVGVGDTVTMITTTGAIDGTFANAPQGATVPIQACPQGASLAVQVTYTADSVTGTVVSGATTTTTVSASPSSPTAGASTTLTASVNSAGNVYDGPSGTVEFLSGTTPISGCTAQPLTATSDTTGTATCVTSFSGSASVTATFTPAGVTGLQGSTSPALSVSVSAAGSSGSGTGSTGSDGAAPSSSGGASPTPSGGSPAGATAGSSPAGSGSTSTGTSTVTKPSTTKVGATRVAGSAVSVPLTCSGRTSCALTLQLQVTETLTGSKLDAVSARATSTKTKKPTKKVVTLGKLSVKLTAGGTRTATLTLNVAGRRLLAQRHTLAVEFVVTSGKISVLRRTLHFSRAVTQKQVARS